MVQVLLKTFPISNYDLDGPLDAFITVLEKVRDEAKADGVKNVRIDTDYEYENGSGEPRWTMDIIGDTE